jgi:hypothetical protein
MFVTPGSVIVNIVEGCNVMSARGYIRHEACIANGEPCRCEPGSCVERSCAGVAKEVVERLSMAGGNLRVICETYKKVLVLRGYETCHMEEDEG